MDDNNLKIQCIECGNYFKVITYTHIKKCHCNMTMKEYREKYPELPLTSNITKQKMSEVHKDKKDLPETRKKKSESRKGNKSSMYGKFGENHPAYKGKESKSYQNQIEKNIERDKGEKIQCFNCYLWFKHLNIDHIKKCCGMTKEEYSRKYLIEDFLSQRSHEKRKISTSGKNNPNYKFVSKEELINLITSNFSKKEVCSKLDLSIVGLTNKLKEYELNWSELSAYSQVGENNPMYNHVHSEKTKNNISKTHKESFENGRKPWNKDIKTGPLTFEHKENLRKSMLKYLKSCCGQDHPNYNLDACKFFKFLNLYCGWEGIYAENLGEFYIEELGYWLDYYEPILNVVIEWDEKRHYKNNLLREEDIIREDRIKNYLHCKFIRIKEEVFPNYRELVNTILYKVSLL
mgnify:CR=1 FL=1